MRADQENKPERGEEKREEEQELETEEKRSGLGAQTQVWQRRKLGRYLSSNQSFLTEFNKSCEYARVHALASLVSWVGCVCCMGVFTCLSACMAACISMLIPSQPPC